MSTGVEFKLYSNSGRIEVQKALDEAAEEFFRIAARFTRFSDQGELSELNRSNGNPTEVSEELFHLLEKSLEFAKFSKGKFDPTVIDLLEMYGYDTTFNPKRIIKQQKKVVNLNRYVKERASWEDIKMNKSKKIVTLQKDQRIDLAGVGKGYAIDRAAQILSKVSQDFLISAGGDIYGKGQNQETKKSWQTELRIKLPDNYLEAQVSRLHSIGIYELNPKGEALAASGSWARSAGKFHHLLNPKTGKPEDNSWQTFVSAKTAITADALATVLFLCGKEFIDKLSKNYQAESLLIDRQMNFWVSDKMSKLIINK